DAVRGLRAAAEQLIGREPDAAAAVLERAVALERDALARAQLTAELAHALLAAGRAGDAQAQATEALATVGLPASAQALVHLTLGGASSLQGRVPEAVAHFHHAIDLDALDESVRARAVGQLARDTAW